MLNLKKIVVGTMVANCYLVFDDKTKQCIIIDPGDDAEYILDWISRLQLQPKLMVATHGHFDHLLAAFTLQAVLQIPFNLHPKDEFLLSRLNSSARYHLKVITDPPPKIDNYLTDKQQIQLGQNSLDVLFTPGHTPGSCCLIDKKNQRIFCGDTLFADGQIGRSDFKYSSVKNLQQSVQILKTRFRKYYFYPGHGESFFLLNRVKKQVIVGYGHEN